MVRLDYTHSFRRRTQFHIMYRDYFDGVKAGNVLESKRRRYDKSRNKDTDTLSLADTTAQTNARTFLSLSGYLPISVALSFLL